MLGFLFFSLLNICISSVACSFISRATIFPRQRISILRYHSIMSKNGALEQKLACTVSLQMNPKKNAGKTAQKRERYKNESLPDSDKSSGKNVLDQEYHPSSPPN